VEPARALVETPSNPAQTDGDERAAAALPRAHELAGRLLRGVGEQRLRRLDRHLEAALVQAPDDSTVRELVHLDRDVAREEEVRRCGSGAARAASAA